MKEEGLARRYKVKVCQRCGVEYHPTTGSQHYCPECKRLVDNKRSAAWKRSHAEKTAASLAAWKGAHPDYDATWRKEHPNHGISWRKEHPGKAKEYDRTFRQQHPEKARIYHVTWCKANPERNRNMYTKHNAKRRTLGFVPVNEFFPGSEAHHIDKDHVVYVPKALHRSIKHNLSMTVQMAEINSAVYGWLTEDWT